MMATGSAPPIGQSGTVFPKRFYKQAEVAAEPRGFGLRLDGKPARTPSRSPIIVPNADLAQALADEWSAVETVIDPREMPLTRLTNSVIDGVSRTAAEVRAEILRYAGSDLLAYRASEPAELVRAQRAAWEPVLAWAAERFSAEVMTAEGVMFVAQPPELAPRLDAALAEAVGDDAAAPFRLGAIHVMTTLTGSTLLAIAVAYGRLVADQAWAAAHVDEDFQIAQWGADDEAAERRARRWTEMRTAARVLDLLRDDK